MTVVRASYFPAMALLPSGVVLSRVYVVLAQDGPDAGLHVYDRPDHEVVRAGIDWARTRVPAVERDAHNGVDVYTPDGLVVVTLSSGCKCGPLGRWRGPGWAGYVTAG